MTSDTRGESLRRLVDRLRAETGASRTTVRGPAGGDPVTTIFVTHSIEEAQLLSTRIGIMSSGRVTHVFDVPFGYPRDVTGVEFNELRREIWGRIEAGVRGEREAGR